MPRKAAARLLRNVAAKVSEWGRLDTGGFEDTGSTAGSLDGVGRREFELLVAEGFRLRGYDAEVAESSPNAADLVLRKGPDTFLLLLKHWKEFRVGPEIVRDLQRLIAACGAAGGFVVTCGNFTPDAVALAQQHNVQLLDATALAELISQGQQSLLRSERGRLS